MLLSIREILVLAPVVFIAYVVLLVLYRLYLSPLAKFPGPKLAAATLWYEFYHDVTLRGKYTWKIAELHKQYGMFRLSTFSEFLTDIFRVISGPIIRISPYELHIDDPE